MNRIAPRELTLPVYADLQHRINEIIVCIKLHHTDLSSENKEAVEKAKASCPTPRWTDVIELLQEAYKALDIYREPVRKY